MGGGGGDLHTQEAAERSLGAVQGWCRMSEVHQVGGRGGRGGSGGGVQGADVNLEGITFRLVLQAAVLGEHAGQTLDGPARQRSHILLPSCAHQATHACFPIAGYITHDVSVGHAQRLLLLAVALLQFLACLLRR